MSKVKILIVEDEVIIAKDIAAYLEIAGYMVIGIAHDSEKALDYIHSLAPDFILLDINIEGTKDGIEVAEVIKKKYDIPFIFLTSYSDKETLSRAKEVNPSGYIVKPFDEHDLMSSITIALHNYQQTKLKNELTLDKINSIAYTPLTEKEFEVLEDLSKGMTNNQIAEKQFVSINTVKFHIKNIFIKLDVINRSSAINKILPLIS